MWGNRLGWGISAAIVVLFVGIGWLIIQAGTTSAPSAFSQSDPLLHKPIALPISPSSIVTMDKPGVAGPLYRKAIDDYKANPSKYDRPAGKPDLDALLPGQKALVDAAPLAQMNLFAETPQDAIGYRSAVEDLDALKAVAKSLTLLALHNQKPGPDKKPNPDRAKKYYEAVFALGAKLFEERVSYAEMSAGLGMMTGGAQQLAQLEDEAGAERLKDFQKQTLAYAGQLGEINRKITMLDNPLNKEAYRYVGDVFAIAQSPKIDRVWRVESLLKIGHYKYNARHKGDQMHATPVLKQYLSDPDPALRTAATMANDLKERDYNLLGG